HQQDRRSGADRLAQCLLPVWRTRYKVVVIDPGGNPLPSQIGTEPLHEGTVLLGVGDVDPGAPGYILILFRRGGIGEDTIGESRAPRRSDERDALLLGEQERVRESPYRVAIGLAAAPLKIEDTARAEAGALGKLLLGQS